MEKKSPWAEKNRPYWKVDVDYEMFETHLYEEFFTFDKVWEFCLVEKYFSFLTKEEKILIQKKWESLVLTWNKEEEKSRGHFFKNLKKPTASCIYTIGFAAVTLFFASLPYSKMKENVSSFSKFEALQIYRILFYLKEETADWMGNENLKQGSVFTDIYKKWIDEKYESASWWMCYRIFEKQQGLNPVIDSLPCVITDSN